MEPVPNERAFGEVDQPMYLLEVCIQRLEGGHSALDPTAARHGQRLEGFDQRAA